MRITANHWQVLSPLVDEALALAPAARERWLDAQSQLSEEAHAQLAELIAVANAPETDAVLKSLPVLPSAAVGGVAPSREREPGDAIGAYTLLRPLGRGGMAEVWLARRNDGAYERDIALKLPLAHLPRHYAAERLLRERNVLASLEHPSIARLYDAGVSVDGQPFLAMEYVEGDNIIDYANRSKLDLRERCKLMIQVLDALHYAHQHLVVHRDLKPGNILVRTDGRVSLLDFGIAKVLDSNHELADDSALTRGSGNALTLAYAAPEQLLGEPVTTAADMYAAGIVFVELLVGRRPFQHAEGSLATLLPAMDLPPIRMNFSELDTNVTEQHGFTSARAWQRAYAGDLTSIGAKALRREPAARYASALSFREDLTRYLALEPVLARAGTFSYYARKFIQRNGTALAVCAMAGAVSIGFATQAWNKTQALKLSSARASAVESVIKSLFEGLSPNSNAQASFTAKQLLDRSLPVLLRAGGTNDDPGSEVTMRMAYLYFEVAAYDDAAKLYQLEIANATNSGDVHRELVAQYELARVFAQTQRVGDAVSLLERTKERLAKAARADAALMVQINTHLASYQTNLGHFEASEKNLKAARELLADANDQPPLLLFGVLKEQGRLARRRGNLEEGISQFQAAKNVLDALERSGVPRSEIEHVSLAVDAMGMQHAAGQHKLVMNTARALKSELLQRFDASNPWVSVVSMQFALAAVRSGELGEAKAQVDSLLANAAKYSATYIRSARVLDAQIEQFRGNASVAYAALSPMVVENDKSPANLESERVRRHLAHTLLQLGRHAEALPILERAEATFVQLGGAAHPDVALTQILSGCALLRAGDRPAATAKFILAQDSLLQSRGQSHYGALLAKSYLALIAATASAETSAIATTLADRVERELGWQAGAGAFASQLRNPKTIDLSIVPALL